MCNTTYIVRMLLLLLLMEYTLAGPGTRSTFLEEESLQLGSMQVQAQYPPAALQGARTASRSAASCLVTAVQYTHGQQIWRADPCEFCLCLDGEMFCWWQDCPPEAPGPCSGPQPFSLCGISSGSFVRKPLPTPVAKKNKKSPHKKATDAIAKKLQKQVIQSKSKPLITVSQNTSLGRTNGTKSFQSNVSNNESSLRINRTNTKQMLQNNNNEESMKEQPYYEAGNAIFNFTNDISKHNNAGNTQQDKIEERDWLIESREQRKKYKTYDKKNIESSIDTSKSVCIIMGKEYQVGEMLPSTGSCLTCHCSKGNGENTPPKVSCAPKGCAPPDPSAQDDTGAF